MILSFGTLSNRSGPVRWHFVTLPSLQTRRHPPMRLEGCPGSGLVRWRVTYLPESMSLVSIGRGNLNHTDSFTNTHRVPVSFPSAFPSSPLAAVG